MVPIKTIQLKAWDTDFTIIDLTRKPGLYNANEMGFKVFTVTKTQVGNGNLSAKQRAARSNYITRREARGKIILHNHFLYKCLCKNT